MYKRKTSPSYLKIKSLSACPTDTLLSPACISFVPEIIKTPGRENNYSFFSSVINTNFNRTKHFCHGKENRTKNNCTLHYA